jgi:hypothetical protein
MKKSLIFFAAFLLVGFFTVPAFAGPFTDVSTDHWAYEAIDYLQSKGFVEGYPDGSFKGDRAYTRYEMAMVTARLWDRLEELTAKNQKNLDMDYLKKADLEEEMDLIKALMKEFESEIAGLKASMGKVEDKLDDYSNRLDAIESKLPKIKWSGLMRVRIESIITDTVGVYGGGQWGGYYEGFWDDLEGQINERCPGGRAGNITPIIGGFGTTPGQGISDPELEQAILLALETRPADYLDIYVSLWQIASYLDSPVGDSFPMNQALVIDEAYMDADLMHLLGWEPCEKFNRFHLIFGRIYQRFGEYGLTFDNGWETRPGFYFDLGGDRLDLHLLLAQNSRNGEMEGLGIFRAAYGFGDSRSMRLERDYFAKVGVNVLASGVGDEDGYGIDLNAEVMPYDWFSLLRFEYLYLNQDQLGLKVEDWYGDDYSNSFIVGVDIFNDGNLKANVAYADIGLPPGFSSVDNNPFEEFDAMWNGIGSNFNYGFESGINMFPANFQGIGFDVQYTWFEKLYSHLAVYDGTNQAEDDLPVVLRLNLRYPLSESSDIALEYIHAGIDYDTIAKLRGEFLVSF